MALNIKIIPVTPYEQNATLLWDDANGEAVLVDVGGDVPLLWAQVQELGLQLKAVWLTHGHLDHSGGVVELLKRADVPVIGPHREDLFLLESLPETTRAYAKHGFEFSPSFVPTRWLEEGDCVSVGTYTFDVLHVFGHTPGHVVFYCAAEKLLIAGDTLFKESVGRTDFPRSDPQGLLDNIRTKLYTLPDDVRVLPGHRDTTTIGYEKQHNPYICG